MSKTWDNILAGQHMLDGLYFQNEDGAVINPAYKLMEEIAEEMADNLVGIELKYEGNDLAKTALEGAAIQDNIYKAIVLASKDNYGVAGIFANINQVTGELELQIHKLLTKPVVRNRRILNASSMTEINVNGTNVIVNYEWKEVPELSSYTITYSAYVDGKKVDPQAIWPSRNWVDKNTEIRQGNISLSLIRSGRLFKSAFATSSDLLTEFNFWNAYKMEDADLSKLKVLVNGKVYKKGFSEINKEFRKGGVIKINSKSYSFTNPYTIVGGTSDVTSLQNQIDKIENKIRKRAKAAIDEFEGKQQKGTAENFKADRKYFIATQTKKVIISDDLKTFVENLSRMNPIFSDVEFEVVTGLDWELEQIKEQTVNSSASNPSGVSNGQQ